MQELWVLVALVLVQAARAAVCLGAPRRRAGEAADDCRAFVLPDGRSGGTLGFCGWEVVERIEEALEEILEERLIRLL